MAILELGLEDICNSTHTPLRIGFNILLKTRVFEVSAQQGSKLPPQIFRTNPVENGKSQPDPSEGFFAPP